MKNLHNLAGEYNWNIVNFIPIIIHLHFPHFSHTSQFVLSGSHTLLSSINGTLEDHSDDIHTARAQDKVCIPYLVSS